MTFQDILDLAQVGVTPESIVVALIPSLILSIVGYVFTAIALFTMAKRRGYKNKAFAFIPFLQYLLLGKVAGDCFIFGKRVKNVGLWACITSAVTYVLNLIYSLGLYIELFAYLADVTITFNSAFIQDFLFSDKYLIIYEIIDMLSIASSIAFIFFDVTIIFQIFKRYAPERALLYSIISIFIEFMFGIFLFTVRNKEPIDYRSFNQTRYYGNYNQPNGNGYNGYNGYYGYGQQPPKPQQEVKKPRNPFPEFGDNDNSDSDNYS